MFKRNLLLILLLMGVLLSVTIGCSSESSTTENSASGSDSEETENEEESITLQFWGGVPADAGPQAVVDDWNENNPNVQVEYNRYVNDDDGNLKLNTALQTGEGVDIFISYAPNILEDRVNSNFVVDLSQFDDYDIDEKMGEKAAKWLVNDKYYAVPTKGDANIVFINQTALEEAGLSVPTEWTWEDLREYAKAMTTENRLGFINFEADYHTNIGNALIDVGWVDENGESNFDHPNVAKGMDIMYEMMHTDNSMMPLGERVSSGVAADHMFLNGEVAMLTAMGGTWLLRNTNNLEEFPRDFDIAFAPLPHFEGSSKSGSSLGDAISISANSPYSEEAWEFIKWYADEGMLHQASGGRIPSSKDADIDEAMSLMVEGVEDTYDIESLERVMSQDGVLLDSPPFEVEDAYKKELERFYIGDGQSLEETVNNMVERHNQFLSN